MVKNSVPGIKNITEKDIVLPAGMEKLKFEIGQEMGISSKAKNNKN